MLRMTLAGAALALLSMAAFPGAAQAGSIDYGSLHGTKWHDLDGDGQRDPGEPGLPGWSIVLTNAAGSVVDTTTTDANGSYWFEFLDSATWELSEILQPGWVQTFPTPSGKHVVTLDFGQVIEGLDFGNREVPEPSSLLLAGLGLLALGRKRRA